MVLKARIWRRSLSAGRPAWSAYTKVAQAARTVQNVVATGRLGFERHEKVQASGKGQPSYTARLTPPTGLSMQQGASHVYLRRQRPLVHTDPCGAFSPMV